MSHSDASRHCNDNTVLFRPELRRGPLPVIGHAPSFASASCCDLILFPPGLYVESKIASRGDFCKAGQGEGAGEGYRQVCTFLLSPALGLTSNVDRLRI
jgi:hypothetical protein